MRILTLTALLFATTLFSCKCTSHATKTETAAVSNTETTDQENTYDVIISFTSKAAGIDNSIKNKVDAIIADFNAKNGNKIEPEIVPWGREGEIDYLFLTKNLSTTEKKSFIAQVKESLGSSDTVFISFDKKAVHKR